MKKIILIITTLFILTSCNSKGISNNQKESVDLNSLSGMNWYKRVLETEDLVEINNTDSIPEFLSQYLKSLDSNFRMANEGEEWQVGCSSPMKFDSTKIVKHRDNKTGEMWSTIGWVKIDAPSRKLVYFGQNKKVAALIYFSGGIAVMQHMILFKIKNGKIIEHWHGGTREDINSQKGILNQIVLGKLQEESNYI